jgi:hypothetical protein
MRLCTVWGDTSTSTPPCPPLGSALGPVLAVASGSGSTSSGVGPNRFMEKLYSTAASTTRMITAANAVRFLSSMERLPLPRRRNPP